MARRMVVPIAQIALWTVLLFCLTSCSKPSVPRLDDTPREGTPPAATSGAALPSAQTGAASSPLEPDASQRSATQVATTRLTRAERATVLAALAAGRAKSRAKDHAGALVEFDKALALAPDDATLLSEVGWAALNAGDLERAERANVRALSHVREPRLRAQILYNQGRAAEAKGNNEAARQAYAESLGLRDNAEVKRRLTKLGGSPPSTLPCSPGASTVEGLCACLLPHTRDMVLVGQTPSCGSLPASLSLGSARLKVVAWGSPEDAPGERNYLLTVSDGSNFRPVAELGIDFEPGAFGVHNKLTVLGGEKRTFEARSVVVVRSRQNDSDMNMAGLEECTRDIERESVCALGEGDRTTRCVNVDLVTTAGCGPGIEGDDLDEEAKRTIAELRKGWAKTTTKRTWTLDAKGALVIRQGEPPFAQVARHELF